jgi:hypothetical protein
MKKFLLIAAVIGMAALGKLMAGETRSVPSADTKQAAFIDYAGAYVSTMAFPNSGAGVGYSTVCINTPGVLYGVNFSSGNAGAYDFVDVWDSTSADVTKGISQFVRLYNVAGSTASGTASISAASGFSGPRVPMRFSNGLIIRPNTATYNMINVLYYKEREDK